jgi:hypothetical protein
MLIEIGEEHWESWEVDKEQVLLLLSAKSLSVSGCLGVVEAEMKWSWRLLMMAGAPRKRSQFFPVDGGGENGCG